MYMVQVSGILLYGIKTDLKEEGRFEEFTAMLTSESKALYDGSILTTNMYPITAWTETIDSLVRMLGPHVFHESMRHKARYLLKKFFGFVLMFLTLEKLLEKMDWMWKRMYQTGKFVLVSQDQIKIVFRIDEFDFSDRFLETQAQMFRGFVEVATKKICQIRMMPLGSGSTQFTIIMTDDDLEEQ